MAGDEVGVVDEVGGADRLGTEAQVRDGDGPGLLGVVDEVALGVEVGLLADDLDRRLVRPDGAIGAEPEEHGLHLAGRPGVADGAVGFQRQARHVVVDAHGEVRLGSLGRQLVEHAGHVGRPDLLGRQAIAAADHPRHAARHRQVARCGGFGERSDHIEVERLADGTRFLGAVEHGDRAGRRRQGGEERRRRERPVQPDGQETDLLARRGHRLDGFGGRAGGRAHEDDHPLGIGRADVVDEPVAATGPCGELVEHLGDDAGTAS